MAQKTKTVLSGFALALVLAACSDGTVPSNAGSNIPGSKESLSSGTMTDPRDGQVYKIVTIGPWSLMTENLRYDAMDHCEHTRPCACIEENESGCIKWGLSQDDRKCFARAGETLVCVNWAESADSDFMCNNYGEYYNVIGTSMECLEKSKIYGVAYQRDEEVCPEGWVRPSWVEWSVVLHKIYGEPENFDEHDRYSLDYDPLNFFDGNDFFSKIKLPIHGLGTIDYEQKALVVFNENEFSSLNRDRYFVRCMYTVPCDRANFGENRDGYICSQTGWGDATVFETMTDERDGNVYRVVIIGSQTWMAENLNFETENSHCYADDPANCAQYGRLYAWNAAMSACPSGWHLPSSAEWNTLFTTVGGQSMAGKALKSVTGFPIDAPGLSDGTDAFGFGALPAGNDNEAYDIRSDGAYFWSSSEYDDDWDFDSYYISLHNYDDNAYLGASAKDLGFSVRCVKD
ncbi:MAG: fibrobacter succinogenes major paralogous domain-containing protein [Fibrobacter sp.]|nr:fibrobacter succinogenes major paralogous domain-containing protein [Fibrobacter sp.]